jgi:hypothetical protein
MMLRVWSSGGGRSCSVGGLCCRVPRCKEKLGLGCRGVVAHMQASKDPTCTIPRLLIASLCHVDNLALHDEYLSCVLFEGLGVSFRPNSMINVRRLPVRHPREISISHLRLTCVLHPASSPHFRALHIPPSSSIAISGLELLVA